MSRSRDVATDIAALLRARNPLLFIVTREEARVEGYLFEAAASAGYIPRTYDCGQGVCDMGGKPLQQIGSADPSDTLAAIKERTQNQRAERGVWIMRDLLPWITGAIGMKTCRELRNLARMLPGVPRENAQAIIIISPSGEVPPELSGHATVIEWPLPDREEIAAILDAAINALPDDLKATAATNGTRDAAIDAAVGLSGEEAAACYARSLVQLRKIDPAIVSNEKKRIIAREGILEWCDALPGGLDSVGGLDQLKAWLAQRRLAYSPQARAYGLPAPKGALLVGVPGCGKSLTAKAIADAWQIPLIKMDLGALKSKFVGESENNLRKAFRVIEAIGRAVLWIDEIEKGLAGATQGAADGGVSADALGSILTWMAERKGQTFVIATANSVEQLPSELLRKGRWDELWAIDLPNRAERIEITMAALRSYGRGNVAMDFDSIAAACVDFTGAEISSLIPDALFAGFADGEREITTEDLVSAAKTVVPLAKTAPEKIAAIREWGKTRARRATSVETPSAATDNTRRLDL